MAKMLGKKAFYKICVCCDCGNINSVEGFRRREKRREQRGWKQGLTDDELDAKIAAWHDAPSDSHIAQVPLHEYLGWTWKEYKHWVEQG